MSDSEYIKDLEAQVRCMQSTITGRANHDRGITPRNQSSGLRVLSKREGEYVEVRNGAVQRRHPAFVVEVELPVPSSQRIYPMRESIKAMLAEYAARGDFEGPEPPQLYDAKVFVQRGPAEFWAALCYYNIEWSEEAGKEVHND